MGRNKSNYKPETSTVSKNPNKILEKEMENIMKRKFRKFICLAACLTMLLGTTITASAKYEMSDDGKLWASLNPPVEGMTEAVIRNMLYNHIYYSNDGGRTYSELANTLEIPLAAPDGSPLWLRQDSAEDDLYVYEAIGTTPGGVYVYLDWSVLYLDDQVAFLYAMIDNAGITNEMPEYDKCVAINNYICGVMRYGASGLLDRNNKKRTTDHNHDPAGWDHNDGLAAVFWDPIGDCTTYADLYQTMCETIGIKCERIDGWVTGGPHFWNEVLADGKTYYVDPTWNDSPGNNGYLMSETMWANHNVALNKYAGYNDYTATMRLPAKMNEIAIQRFLGRTMASQPFIYLSPEEKNVVFDQMYATGITIY